MPDLSLGLKARQFIQPRASPWGTGTRTSMIGPTGQSFASAPGESGTPVAERLARWAAATMPRAHRPQGDALGWTKCWAFGPGKPSLPYLYAMPGKDHLVLAAAPAETPGQRWQLSPARLDIY